MEISAEQLQEKIKNGEKLVVKFGATWCGPCRIMNPIFEKVSNDHKKTNSSVSFYSIDVDTNAEVVRSLGIRSVPTIKSFNNGEVVTTKIGMIQEFQLNELASTLING